MNKKKTNKKTPTKKVSKVVTTVTTTTTTTTVTSPKEIYDFFVLDRSGSMSVIADSTIAGFNEYVNTSKQAAATEGVVAYTSVLLFDNEFILLHDFVNVNSIPKMTRETFVPRNTTSLNDATAKAIQLLLNRLSGREASPNVDVTITVMTDGYENSSKEFPNPSWPDTSGVNKALVALIDRVKGYGWTVNYVGAGSQKDVESFATKIGIDVSNVKAYNATPHETTALFREVGQARGIKSASYAATGMKCNTGYFASNSTVQVDPVTSKTTELPPSSI